MTQVQFYPRRRPSRGHLVLASAAAGGILVAAAATMPFSTVELPVYPGFMPAFGGLILLTDVITAGLLMAKARLTANRLPLWLAGAFILSALLAMPHLLAFPGVLAQGAMIGQGGNAVWLWCAWHLGFPLYVIRFAHTRPGPLGRADWLQSIGIAVAAAAVLVTLATVGVALLPSLLQGNSFNRLNELGIGPAILGTTIVATILVTTRLRARDTLSLWLAVSMLAATFDVGLTISGGGRFTLGWYVARLLALTTNLTTLFALLSDLVREAGRVRDVNARLEQMLRTDMLTNLANRRAFQASLSQEWRRAYRDQTAVSLLMIDIDSFKGYNDRYGHPAGDRCLRSVADAVAREVRRPADLAARLGGEEFGVLLPTTDEAGALMVAERIRAGVADLLLAHEASSRGHVTVSVGVATCRPYGDVETEADLVSTADQALYRAKTSGRDRIEARPAPKLVNLPTAA